MHHHRDTRPPAPSGHRCSLSNCRTGLSCQLDREWRRLRRLRSTMPTIRSWTSGDDQLDRWAHDQIASTEHLDGFLEQLGRQGGTDADHLLHWLLLVPASESLARRIVLQRVLPLVIAQTARRQRLRNDDAVAEALAAVTIAIASYDHQTCPRHVAPRLVSSAMHQAFRKPRRRRSHSSEVATGPTAFTIMPAPADEIDSATAAARVLAAGAAAGVDADLIDVAHRLVRGESTSQIAAVRRCTPRAVRWQRHRVVECLRERLDRSWADWSDPLTGLEFETAAA